MSRRTNRGVGALSVVLALGTLSACSAGQLAETAQQNSTVDGTHTDVGDISLRDVTLAFPADGAYQAGDDAQLLFVATNQNPVDSDRLVSVSSSAASGAQTDASPADVTVPAGGSLQVGLDGPVVELTGLTEELAASVTIPVTFTFARAGSVTFAVPVGVPLATQERAEPFDFTGTEG